MKATASILDTDPSRARPLAATLADLFKARLTSLVLLTTFVGFQVGTRGPLELALLGHLMAATALLAAGASALNQLLEQDLDARMKRTETRPLPAGRLQPDTVLVLGGVCAAVGLVWLALGVNLLTSLLGAITLGVYLFIYTPAKRVTTLNTVIGAVPGALPPLMGWTAATDSLSAPGWTLFAILFFWQLPHFLAIAWLYREDYARAGFAMLPAVDPDGQRTGAQAVQHTLALLLVSLSPFVVRLAGVGYLLGACLLGAGFLAAAVGFGRRREAGTARRLFWASILYLPLLLGLMVMDKID